MIFLLYFKFENLKNKINIIENLLILFSFFIFLEMFLVFIWKFSEKILK